MTGSVPLRWILVLLSAGAGGWFLFRGVRPGSDGTPPGVTDRITHLAHALMAATMAAMMWPMG